jgi:hypothetical protein
MYPPKGTLRLENVFPCGASISEKGPLLRGHCVWNMCSPAGTLSPEDGECVSLRRLCLENLSICGETVFVGSVSLWILCL